MACTIMVVDDDRGVLQALEVVVKDMGFAVCGIHDPADVFSNAIEIQPKLILMDLYMGDVDGRELIHQLKTEPRTADIPIILMSADSKIRSLSKDVPVANFLKKPFDIDDLEKLLKQYLPDATE